VHGEVTEDLSGIATGPLKAVADEQDLWVLSDVKEAFALYQMLMITTMEPFRDRPNGAIPGSP